ncbi:unnamed protein product [Tenebrio molitor]|nr:unnamed protein product [Tenebrio molitor]
MIKTMAGAKVNSSLIKYLISALIRQTRRVVGLLYLYLRQMFGKELILI